jgi:hypothetical protein
MKLRLRNLLTFYVRALGTALIVKAIYIVGPWYMGIPKGVHVSATLDAYLSNPWSRLVLALFEVFLGVVLWMSGRSKEPRTSGRWYWRR